MALVVAVLAPSTAAAGTYEIRPGDDLFARLSQLVAGDEVIVHAGTYVTPGFYEVTWTGTSSAPIIIRGADGELPIIQGDPSQNVINITGSYFTFRNFEIVGGSHGLRLATADHATFEDLRLHQLGDVGISCNRPGNTCTAVTIRHCEIFDTGAAGTGEGLYLGCNDESCRFLDGLIANNYIHDLGGSQGDGIEIKPGSWGNTVQDNVVVRSRYPGITLYGFAAGAGGPNVVERNLVWTSQDNGIQLTGQAIIRNNIVLAAAASGIASKPSNGYDPHDATIAHNTVVGGGDACLKGNSWNIGVDLVAIDNALYCGATAALRLPEGAGSAMVQGNVGLGTSDLPAGVTTGVSIMADLGDPASAQVYPPPGSALIEAGIASAVVDDFNGTARPSGLPDVGAYEVTTPTNPGWPPGEGFKDPVVAPGGDHGAGNDAVGDGGGNGGGGCCDGAENPASPLCGTMLLLWAFARRRGVAGRQQPGNVSCRPVSSRCRRDLVGDVRGVPRYPLLLDGDDDAAGSGGTRRGSDLDQPGP